MENKKVIISANVIYTITNFRKDFIVFLKKNGYEVVCVADLDDLSNSSINILKSLDIKFIKIDISRKGLNPIEDLKYLFSLYKVYKKEKPTVIMHFTIKPNIYGTIASSLLSIPSINTINGLGSAIIRENFLSMILKYLYKFSLQFSTKIFFQNNDDKDFFLNNSIVSEDKVSIIPGSGVDTQNFDDCISNNSVITFLLVARLLKDKGIYEYVEAIKKIKEKGLKAKFLLAGQFDFGNPSAISKEDIKKWEIDNLIEYIGRTDNIKDFFKLTDIIVLPSYREGLSRVLVEAASASKPIITTNVAGCKDIVINNKNGYLCEARDIESLQTSIENMISLSLDDRKRMANFSKIIAQTKFDKDIVNKIYYKEIEKL